MMMLSSIFLKGVYDFSHYVLKYSKMVLIPHLFKNE